MKILLVRFSSLGDVVLATSAVENVVTTYPSAELLFLTKQRYSPLFAGDQRLKVVSFRTEPKNWIQVAELSRTCKALCKLQFDFLIDLQGNPRSFILRSCAGSKRSVTYPKGHLERRSYVKRKNFRQPYIHSVDRYNRALKEAGLATPNRLPKLVITEEEEQLAEELLKGMSLDVNRPLIGIHFGAKYPMKRWGDKKFAELATRFVEQLDVNVVVFPSPEDLPQERLFLAEKGNIVWTGALSLRELKVLISGCEVLVCNDSGVMHVAVALRVPVVSIFGPTHPCLGFYPLGEHDMLLSSYEYCSPCSLHGERKCFRDKRYCMENVSVSQVLEATVSLLSKKGEKVRQGR